MHFYTSVWISCLKRGFFSLFSLVGWWGEHQKQEMVAQQHNSQGNLKLSMDYQFHAFPRFWWTKDWARESKDETRQPDSSINLNSLVTFPPCLLAQEASKVQISWIIQLFLQKALAGNRTSDLPGGVPSALTIQLLQQMANLLNKFNIWMSIMFDWLIVTKINFPYTSTFIYILGTYLDF